MSRNAVKPGPRPTSCLTCRQRRKKCDLSQPCCERCLQGGYECLGYEDIKHRKNPYQTGPSASTSSQLRSVPEEVVGSGVLDSATTGLSENQSDLTGSNADRDSRTAILGTGLLYRMREPAPSSSESSVTIGPAEEFDRLWPQEQGQLAVRTRQLSRTRRNFNHASRAKPAKNGVNRVIQSLCQSIPRSVDATQMMKEDHFRHVLHDYDIQRVRQWFTTPSPAIRASLIAQLKGSKQMLWAMYLGARLLQALSQDSYDTTVGACVSSIDQLEQKIAVKSRANPTLNEIADFLMVQIELAYLKFAIFDTASGYIQLQKAVPRFLQLVATNPSLYKEHPDGNLVVLFPHIFCAPRYELERFVIYETAASLVLGVPPLVEYGYSGGCGHSSQLEWIHGIPIPFVEVMSQINSWRAGSRVPLDDWQVLESRVLAWQPPPPEANAVSATNFMTMARISVQESWRHLVLIYIYMGICGVSSHDSRVQASVHRIVQLGETVASLPTGIHMFTHCVVAGLAARLEKHRVLLYEKLLSFKGAQTWLFRGPQFSQVLYHLWHGVGEGGAPIMWDDYVRSRCSVIPI